MKNTKVPWWRNRTRLAFFAFLGIAGYFLWTEHQAHIAPYLVWILLIACLKTWKLKNQPAFAD
jgi:hypothetical protein